MFDSWRSIPGRYYNDNIHLMSITNRWAAENIYCPCRQFYHISVANHLWAAENMEVAVVLVLLNELHVMRPREVGVQTAAPAMP